MGFFSFFSPSVEDKIERRKKEAERKRILSKVAMVVKWLGQQDSSSSYSFSDAEFSLSYCDDGGRSKIHLSCGQIVFETDGHSFGNTVICFVPGDWENHLESLQKKAIESQAMAKHNLI